MEWQSLLDHIDYYVYSHETEQIHFLIGEYTEVAKNNYSRILSATGMDNNIEDAWAFDIALDALEQCLPKTERI